MAVNLNGVETFDSCIYREMLEFIKKEGIEPFERLIQDISNIYPLELIDDQILSGRNPVRSIIYRNKTAVEFLRKFGNEFLHQIGSQYNVTASSFLDRTYFRAFVQDASVNISRIKELIKNARLLEELRISCIMFVSNLGANKLFSDTHFFQTEVYKHNGTITDINKIYSDGIIRYFGTNDEKGATGSTCLEFDSYENTSYERIGASISPDKKNPGSPSWVIRAENHHNGSQFRSAMIQGFGFNSDCLPTSGELSRYEEPLSLRLYRKKQR